jgi:Domain of unknown function (DUF4262)
VQEHHGEPTPEQKQILADIVALGAHIAHVPASDDWPEYSYTAGLTTTFGHPELILFGLEPESAEALLDALIDEIDEGRRFEVGSEHEGLLRNYPLRIHGVPPAMIETILPRALWASGGTATAVQLVWPDKQGRWPWQDDVREGFAELQPVLDRIRDEA